MPITIYYHNTIPSAGYGGSITEGIVGSPRTINPALLQNNSADNDLSRLIYSGLMGYDKNGNLETDLAKEYQLSEDHLKYAFTLKEAYWHDKKPVTPSDIVFTIRTIQNADFDSPQRPAWEGVGVEAIDEQTVIFTLKNPYAQFLNNATVGIMPKHIWQDILANQFSTNIANVQAIGSGPYMIDSIDTDEQTIQKVELKAFDEYHNGKPYINEINIEFFDSLENLLTAYRRGKIDSFNLPTTPEQSGISISSGINKLSFKQPRYFSVFFNGEEKDIFNDKNIRLSLQYATNKQKIVYDILKGDGSVVESPFLPGIIPIEQPTITYAFDKAKAIELLDSEDWKLSEGSTIRSKGENDDKIELSFKLTTLNILGLPEVGQEIVNQWAEVGVDVQLEILPISELLGVIQERTYDALLFGESLAYDPDPFGFWHSSRITHPGINIAIYRNKRVDSILEKARATINAQERLTLYNEAQNIIIADSPAVFLYTPMYTYIQRTSIKGNETKLISVPSDRFNNIEDWYVNTDRVKKTE